ncbi:EthD family reductase [Nissabacter sp. SGAir0207]|uniref:EthD family reductase n=1 Tax=Nissabacter sp. SGAir0207 TaxID=2126321 RepID=UPI0010CD1C54|nr:EthD family reductase [Nissabacter sp. SGAir0207]QCR38226.1 EthD family reductase [Nissabacter sp. SGAir0207]
MSVILYVSYTGTAQDRFDREYYSHKHVPMVIEAWKACGLVSAQALYPLSLDENQPGTVAICECVFRDEAALEAALSAPGTPALVADVPNFTDLAGQHHRGAPL